MKSPVITGLFSYLDFICAKYYNKININYYYRGENMDIESDIFRRKKLIAENLVKYGFVKTKNEYTYSETFMDGEFRADISVFTDGSVKGKVIETEVNEEYLPVHAESRTGPFVGTIREEYRNVLRKIADSCYRPQLFSHDQPNRITALIEERYGEKPDFPFKDDDYTGVFRYPKNRKWYGIIMYIRKYVITGNKPQNPEKSPIIEIMNVKVGAERIPEFLKINGIYPSYHMMKTNWITVLLDETLPDEKIMELIEISRNFAVASKSRVR
ncbi:MAG: MmcQ/YjbR family DNA-binding protein [Clostridia bacterium]|nr:MmcQ/YjbR family DNA-binding protein [Clostridia bacterium]